MWLFYEEVLLIALHPEKGIMRGNRAVVESTAAGGILTELALGGCLELDDKNRVNVIKAQSFGDPILDAALGVLKGSSLTLPQALLKLTTFQKQPIEFSVYAALTEKGILRSTVSSSLLGFKTTHFSLVQTEVLEEISERVRKAALAPGSTDQRTVMLLGLISRAGLVKYILTNLEITALNAANEEVYASLLEKRSQDKSVAFFFDILAALGVAVQRYGGV